MKKSYRLAVESLYAQALKSARVQVKKVTAHKDASATVPSNEKIAAAVKALPGVEILAEGKTEITFRIPAAVEYHTSNPPNKTPEQREAEAAERAARKAERDAKRAARLLEASEDGDDESEEESDEDADEESE